MEEKPVDETNQLSQPYKDWLEKESHVLEEKIIKKEDMDVTDERHLSKLVLCRRLDESVTSKPGRDTEAAIFARSWLIVISELEDI